MGLYVETRVRGTGLETLWERTQEPADHQRWDLRFTEISYLDTAPDRPRRFRYAVRLLPGLTLAGTGIAAGERRRPDGTRTSALRFASPHPLSLLAEGRGYWRYVPGPDGIRFLTGYDYTPRWGRFGRLADHHLFRPLIGWATAWSFDRLRLWCERGLTPERTRRRWLAETALRLLAVAGACAALLADHPLGAYAPLLAPVLLLAALLLPPLPGTPAARRCLRRPPRPTTAPALLDRLEQP